MEQSQYNFLFSFIWNIANDVLVNAFNKGDYKKVILPMLVLRRIDVLLEPTKDAVIQMKDQLDKNKIENQAPVLYNITGYPFYNTSKFTMKTLKSEIDPLRLKMNFIEYLNGYSRMCSTSSKSCTFDKLLTTSRKRSVWAVSSRNSRPTK